ncbi:GT-D fold domain-containing glycosyltransferase [Paenibacillus thermoaerophilus]|uniref:GT-D fold domain-containing glycosyltransferase n=1 Tax=Paenibacillus thermoaerophilus TaxID=1215385 RepID=A0ABW2V6S2_9BACL|nr:GT-D fold domain-containing glycosyltransferase [Paenibacillus thermoaerophilus]TMV18834.1 hypothetical protein FE781_02590 [Paenibacillus thermoaerophilus]
MAAYLNFRRTMNRIGRALKRKRPLSLVRIGDGENIVLAQNTVWPMRQVLEQPWAVKANQGLMGVRLPNLQVRDRMVRAIRQATIVGVLPPGDRIIKAPAYLKRPLTDKVFRYYGLKPKLVCHACVNRQMPGKRLFWKTIRNRRLLIVNRDPDRLRQKLERQSRAIRVTETVRLEDAGELPLAMKRIYAARRKFDLALLSCGVNAVILAPWIAGKTGRVAIDFGSAFPDRSAGDRKRNPEARASRLR